MKVAVRWEKHSPILGQHASWQTECNFSSPKIAFARKYSCETGARTLIQSGCFRSIIAVLEIASLSLSLRLRSLRIQLPPNLRCALSDDRVIAEDPGEAFLHRGAELAHRNLLAAKLTN